MLTPISEPVLDPRAWVQTVSGRRLRPADPDPDEIFLDDIAHHLAHLCRFTGATRVFYSVAQHSIEVAAELPPELRLAGLLHDAAEAYLGDLSTPVKRQCPAYRELERRVAQAVAERFSIDPALLSCPDVKRADRVLLATEKRDLLDVDLDGWPDLPEPRREPVVAGCSEWARGAFLGAMFDAGEF